MEWQWTDLMVRDKLKFTKEGKIMFDFKHDKVITIVHIEILNDQEGEYISLTYKDKKGKRSGIWMGLDGTRQNIILFKLIELAKE